MKAVLVIDEMPKSCAECILNDYKWCNGKRKHMRLPKGQLKPKWCPLKEIPDTVEDLEEYTKRVVKEKLESILNSIKEIEKEIEG